MDTIKTIHKPHGFVPSLSYMVLHEWQSYDAIEYSSTCGCRIEKLMQFKRCALSDIKEAIREKGASATLFYRDEDKDDNGPEQYWVESGVIRPIYLIDAGHYIYSHQDDTGCVFRACDADDEFYEWEPS